VNTRPLAQLDDNNQQLSQEGQGNLFSQKTKIFEDHNVELFVEKTGFKRQTRFTLDDHLFLVKIHFKNEMPVLFSTIMGTLKKAFSFMIKSLKTYYGSGTFKMLDNIGKKLLKPLILAEVYVSILINQAAMTSPINSGYFALQSSGMETNIVDTVLNLLNRFVNSNAEVSLDDSFSVYFRVYNGIHSAHIKKKQKKHLVGSPFKSNLPGTLNASAGYPDNPLAFQTLCLLTSIVLGNLKSKLSLVGCEERRDLLKEWDILMNVCDGEKRIYHYGSGVRNLHKKKFKNPSSDLRNKSGQLFLEKVKPYLEILNLPQDKKIDLKEVAQPLATHLGVQIHVIMGITGARASVLSFPSKFDDSKPQIVLENLRENHVNFVSNIKMFLRNLKTELCFACYKIFCHGSYHRCAKKTQCFSCKRFNATSQTVQQSDPFFSFCDSQIQKPLQGYPIQCPTCNSSLATESCQKKHESVCGKQNKTKAPLGRAGYFCEKCKTHFKLGFKNAADAKANHICCNQGVKSCWQCKKPKDIGHQCLVSPIVACSKIPNLAFFVFSFQCPENCSDCFLVRESFQQSKNLSYSEVYLHEEFLSLGCEKHKNSSNFDSTPNAGVILKEISRGKFKRVLLYDDDLEKNIFVANESENYDYFPEIDSQKSPSSQEMRQDIKVVLSNLTEKVKKSVVDKFLIEILKQEYYNTTFLSFNADILHNQLILKALTNLNIIPFVIQDSGKVKLVSIKQLSIRFLNASSYLDGTLEDWIKQFSLKNQLYYFPEKYEIYFFEKVFKIN